MINVYSNKINTRKMYFYSFSAIKLSAFVILSLVLLEIERTDG